MNITEKVSYIKGLAEGLKLEETTKEGKILLQILDLLTDMAYQIEDIDNDLNDMAAVVDEVDDAVFHLQEEIYGDEDDCDCCGEDMYEITCPKCSNTVAVDFNVISDGGILCPNCGESLEFDLSELEDEIDED